MSLYRAYVEEVRAEYDLRDLLAERGRKVVNGMVVCPFHADSNPSCSVTDRLYCCFACGAKGDVFRFIQILDGLSFAAAVDALAKRAGLPVYRPLREDALRVQQEVTTAALTEFAAVVYERSLQEGSEPWRYLTDARGLPPSLIRERRLGWARNGALTGPCPDDEVRKRFVAAGLAIEARNAASWSGQSPYRDLLIDRITFPAIGPGRQATFLSGRTMDPSIQPKYLNQRDVSAPLYNQDVLTGAEVAFLVEGQIDALSLQAWEYPAAAPMGTMHTEALAPLRGRALVYLCLDADRAGQSALLRLAPAIRPTPVRCVRLPDGMDPNDFYRTRSRSEFQALVDRAADPVDFALGLVSPDTPPDQIDGCLTPLFNYLALLPPTTVQAYLSEVIAPWAGGRKGMVKAIEESVGHVRQKIQMKCPVCSTVLVGRRGV